MLARFHHLIGHEIHGITWPCMPHARHRVLIASGMRPVGIPNCTLPVVSSGQPLRGNLLGAFFTTVRPVSVPSLMPEVFGDDLADLQPRQPAMCARFFEVFGPIGVGIILLLPPWSSWWKAHPDRCLDSSARHDQPCLVAKQFAEDGNLGWAEKRSASAKPDFRNVPGS